MFLNSIEPNDNGKNRTNRKPDPDRLGLTRFAPPLPYKYLTTEQLEEGIKTPVDTIGEDE